MEIHYRQTEWLEFAGSLHEKPTFCNKLRLEEHGSKEWVLLEPFTYATLVLGHPLEITVRQNFITDLASIPQLAQFLISKVGRHRLGAIIHDGLYREAGKHPVTRSQADSIFLEAMKAANVPLWRRSLMYSAVRAGGWVTWNASLKRNT